MLAFQSPEFKTLADNKILALQKSKMKISADFKILVFPNSKFWLKILPF